MSFADTYIKRYATARIKDLGDPDPGLSFIIVLPAYNEPDLGIAIDSLLTADPPGCPWEIIVVINEPVACPVTYHEQNISTIGQIKNYISSVNRDDLKIHYIYPEPFPIKKAGPGFARKIGMDEALRRFNQIGRPDGIIVSYDADTRCSFDYLTNLISFYHSQPQAAGCTVYFEHPLSQDNFVSPEHSQGIIQYELFMRYFRRSLEWMGFPYSCYSLGSAFSVKASRYAVAGGMGLQQAGEDFYFLQKCLPLGDFWEVNKASVFPSPRFSDRVVFGTGPRIDKFIREGEKYVGVYQFNLFAALRPLLKYINKLERAPSAIEELNKYLVGLNDDMRDVLIELNWPGKIGRAINESAGADSFRRRFYHEINLLQLIRFFNEMELKGFQRMPVMKEFKKLPGVISENENLDEPVEFLLFARKNDRERGNFRIS